MLSSPGRRFIIVGLLVALMFIPLFFAAAVIEDRKAYSRTTLHSVGQDWGGPQVLAGPQLVIPVTRQVTQTKTRPRLDPISGQPLTDEAGKGLFEQVEETEIEEADPVFILPGQFEAALETRTELRSRGIFEVPVYRALAQIRFDFDPELALRVLAETETAHWEQAQIRFAVSNNRALRGDAKVEADGQALELQPLTRAAGFQAAPGDPRKVSHYAMTLEFNGAERLMIAPVGLDSRVTMTSDWPHPSFSGAFLPDSSEISETGFSADWSIPHLARSLPLVSRTDPQKVARDKTAFGLTFVQPNDFYQKAYRAARYGILFVALTFLTVLLIERGTRKPVHPVQYILIGLVQTVFVLLMVSYAEHLGFGPAYLIASGATIGLLTAFAQFGLKLGRRALVLGAMLIVVYVVLYLILQSTDYALLAGSTLAFLAIGLTMWATRNEEWFLDRSAEPDAARPGVLGRMFGPTNPAQTPAQAASVQPTQPPSQAP